MFGTFRFLLALIVAFSHLTLQATYMAHTSVFAFYALSGYLITRVLNETYRYNVSGLSRFALNRFLRLYPVYYIVFAITLLLTYIAPREALLLAQGLEVAPSSMLDWFRNLSIIGMTRWTLDGTQAALPARLVENSWSLSIELWFYLIMAAGIIRKPALIGLWVGVAYLFTFYGFWEHLGFYARYLPASAGMLPFALGASLYPIFLRDPLRTSWILPLVMISVAGWIALNVIGHYREDMVITGDLLYPSLICSTLIIAALIHVKPAQFPRMATIDRWLGDFSYPLFLSHHMIAIIMKSLFPALHAKSLFFATLPVLLLFCWLIAIAVDRPIDRLRARIRPKKIRPLSSSPI